MTHHQHEHKRIGSPGRRGEGRGAASMECGGDVGWRIGRIRQAAAVAAGRAEHATRQGG